MGTCLFLNIFTSENSLDLFLVLIQISLFGIETEPQNCEDWTATVSHTKEVLSTSIYFSNLAGSFSHKTAAKCTLRFLIFWKWFKDKHKCDYEPHTWVSLGIPGYSWMYFGFCPVKTLITLLGQVLTVVLQIFIWRRRKTSGRGEKRMRWADEGNEQRRRAVVRAAWQGP